MSLQDNTPSIRQRGSGGLRAKPPIIVLRSPTSVHFLPGSVLRWHSWPVLSASSSFPQLSSAELRIGISTLPLVAASAMGYMAWRRWRKNEYAMRLENDLPYTRLLVVLSILMLVLAILLGILLWQGRPL